MKNLMMLAIFALMFAACGQETSYENDEKATDDYHQEGDEMSAEDEGDGVHFGEKIDEEGAISFEELMELMQERDSVHTRVIARVDDVCLKKGCWMNVYGEEGTAEESIFVQFHDYSFFMPLDLGGGKVVMEGYAYEDWTSVADLQHFAEDAGASPEEIAAITEPEFELKFMASGVKILEH